MQPLRALLVGGSFGLVCGFVWTSLALAGVINIPLAHGMVVAAWVLSVFMIFTAEPYWPFAERHRVAITLGSAALLGLGALYLWRLEREPPPLLTVATKSDVQDLRVFFEHSLQHYNGSIAQLFDVKLMD
jgi:hypothetical protein